MARNSRSSSTPRHLQRSDSRPAELHSTLADATTSNIFLWVLSDGRSRGLLRVIRPGNNMAWCQQQGMLTTTQHSDNNIIIFLWLLSDSRSCRLLWVIRLDNNMTWWEQHGMVTTTTWYGDNINILWVLSDGRTNRLLWFVRPGNYKAWWQHGVGTTTWHGDNNNIAWWQHQTSHCRCSLLASPLGTGIVPMTLWQQQHGMVTTTSNIISAGKSSKRLHVTSHSNNT